MHVDTFTYFCTMDHNSPILKALIDQDHYSRWLGLIIDDFGLGYCKLHFTIRQEMLNGFGIVHGGIVFSAADSAFAFACNSHGRLSVALDVQISFIRPAQEGDTLHVDAKEIHLGYKTSFYDIAITNEQKEIVATFKSTAYRTSKNVIPDAV